jgi:hypothetical protein
MRRRWLRLRLAEQQILEGMTARKARTTTKAKAERRVRRGCAEDAEKMDVALEYWI